MRLPLFRKKLPPTPIILYTMHVDAGVKQLAAAAGIAAVMSKSDPVGDLLKKANTLVGTSCPSTLPWCPSKNRSARSWCNRDVTPIDALALKLIRTVNPDGGREKRRAGASATTLHNQMLDRELPALLQC
jgi:hypothetical protein